MKRKLVWMLWVAAVLGLVLTGCGQQRTQASYIGADAAKAIALDAAGIAEGRSHLCVCGPGEPEWYRLLSGNIHRRRQKLCLRH